MALGASISTQKNNYKLGESIEIITTLTGAGSAAYVSTTREIYVNGEKIITRNALRVNDSYTYTPPTSGEYEIYCTIKRSSTTYSSNILLLSIEEPSSFDIVNKTVTDLQIDNKTIKTIEVMNSGVIIYQKPQGYKLTLTSDKTTATINTVVYLIATLTYNGEPITGGVIFGKTDANGDDFYPIAVNRPTDENGIARLGWTSDTPNTYYLMAMMINNNDICSNVIQITVQNSGAGGTGIK